MALRLRVMLQHQSPQGGQKSHRQPPAAASVGHARAVLVGGVQITTTICAVVLPGLHRAVAGGVIHGIIVRNRICPSRSQDVATLCAGIYIHFGFPAGRVADILVGNSMPFGHIDVLVCGLLSDPAATRLPPPREAPPEPLLCCACTATINRFLSQMLAKH